MVKRKRVYKARTNEQFLEQLSFIRFVSGFRHKLVDDKWEDIKDSLHQFNMQKLANATEKDIDKMLQHPNIIRNRGKYINVVQNAKLIQDISREHGDVIKWISNHQKEWEKDQILSPSLQEIFQRFHGIGETTSGWLHALYSQKKNHITYIVPGT